MTVGRPQGSCLRAWLWGLALLAGLAGLTGECFYAIGAAQAGRARAALDSNQPEAALQAAESALRWDPYQLGAQYSQLVALKRLGRWTALLASVRQAALWHPDSTALLPLWGEAAWITGQPAEAAQAAWALLWRVPLPPHNAVPAWRLALLAGRAAWGNRDPRVLAAAVRLRSLLESDDPTLPPSFSAQARREAAEALHAAGAPLSAREATLTRPRQP